MNNGSYAAVSRLFTRAVRRAKRTPESNSWAQSSVCSVPVVQEECGASSPWHTGNQQVAFLRTPGTGPRQQNQAL